MLDSPHDLRNRSSMIDDPLSNVLRLADVQSVVSGGFSAWGDWAISFPPPDKVKFFAAVRGACWLRFHDEPQPIRVETGDVILLAAARGFTLASQLDIAPVSAYEIFSARAEGEDIASIGSAGDPDRQVLQIGGHLQLHPTHGSLLADVLPPVIHVHGATPEARALHWIVDQLFQERGGLPGAGLASSQLALLLFVQVLRAHLNSGGQLRASWLRAATDRRIAPALQLMHAEPGRAWRVDELARAAMMSRTSFATHFRSVAGEAPLTYLTRWRMRLAEHALLRGDAPIVTLAQTLGYSSESAFSHAFKRILGQSPKHYVDSHARNDMSK
jgi:AraC-like DNA-binding protein